MRWPSPRGIFDSACANAATRPDHGSQTVKVAPAPGMLATSMPPPRSVTMPCTSPFRPLL
jgi:hypothetical protein